MRRIKAAWTAFLNPKPKPLVVNVQIEGKQIAAELLKHARRNGGTGRGLS